MKKLSYLFLLLVGIWLAGCDDSSEASLIPEIIPTEQGSDTYVMKGYESSDNGFNVYKPKAIGTPFYIQSKAFTGRNYAFAPVNSESLEGLTVVPSADAFSESVEVKPSTCYWVRFNRYNHYQMGKLRVAYIHGNEVGIEYVASEDIDVKNANIADNNKADNLEIPALNATNQYIEYYAGVSDEEGAGQVLNFSLEYIASKKHSAWVAFSFDPITAQDNVKRANEWNQDDPNIDNSVYTTSSAVIFSPSDQDAFSSICTIKFLLSSVVTESAISPSNSRFEFNSTSGRNIRLVAYLLVSPPSIKSGFNVPSVLVTPIFTISSETSAVSVAAAFSPCG